MDAMHFLMGLAACFALGMGLLGVLAAAVTSRRLQALALESGQGSGHAIVARLLRNGIGAFVPLAAGLGQVSIWSQNVDRACQYLGKKGFDATPASAGSVMLATCLAVLIGGSLACGSVLGGAACVSALVAVCVARLQGWQQAQNDAVREAVPEALRSMSACSQAGLSLQQMLETVAAETQEGLKELFERSVHVLQTGGKAHDALACLRGGTNVPELAFVSVALDVQHQTGASLKQVLDAAHDMVEGELELRRSLRVQTAQARLSARVVSIMPFVMLALFSLISQDFLKPFFSSAWGLGVLVVALLMQLTGIVIVRRMLKVGD